MLELSIVHKYVQNFTSNPEINNGLIDLCLGMELDKVPGSFILILTSHGKGP